MRRNWKRALLCSVLSLCLVQGAEAAQREAGRQHRVAVAQRSAHLAAATRAGKVAAARRETHVTAVPRTTRVATARKGSRPLGAARRVVASPTSRSGQVVARTITRRGMRTGKERQVVNEAAARRGGGQQGHASIYSHRFAGRRMADGGRFDPRSDSVASRTLPLGTQARVTNLRNGRSTIVRVRDRGPHVRGRILDVSPGVAARLGMAQAGIAPIRIVALEEAPAGPVGRASAAGIPGNHRR